LVGLILMIMGGWIKAQTTDACRAMNQVLTLGQAQSVMPLISAAAPLRKDIPLITDIPANYQPPYTIIEPVRLFDNLYFVGTNAVGAFVLNTEEGLILFDTGCGEADASIMAEGMKKLGLKPEDIRIIFISHEHFDHYGGVQYFKKNHCRNAKVAMGLVAWNFLQTVPSEGAFAGSRPQEVDIYLTDGMKIKCGETIVQIVATPGHSAGCMSFIFPVTDNGTPHMAGIMGGSAVFPTPLETYLYKTSVEYFRAFAEASHCDVGLAFHCRESDFTALRTRKNGDSHPLVIGTEKFDLVYLQGYRDRYQAMVKQLAGK